MTTKSLYFPSQDSQLSAYMKQVVSYPVLSQQEESELAKLWYYKQDKAAAQKLVISHLRLVVKIAYQFKGYGLNVSDLISEGNIGLMQAVKKFDPEKGFRLTTYAVWWIRANIIEYILRSWSIVRIGTVSGRKKLFFSLNAIKKRLNILDRVLTDKDIKSISKEYKVSEEDVKDINLLFTSHDTSLSAPVSVGGDDSIEYGETLPDTKHNPEELAIEDNRVEFAKKMLVTAMNKLSDREKDILNARFKEEGSDSLEVLGNKYGISRERVRQIEARALEKLKGFLSESGVTPALVAG